MAGTGNKWYQSPAVVGLIITLLGFGLFTLAFWLISEWMLP